MQDMGTWVRRQRLRRRDRLSRLLTLPDGGGGIRLVALERKLDSSPLLVEDGVVWFGNEEEGDCC